MLKPLEDMQVSISIPTHSISWHNVLIIRVGPYLVKVDIFTFAVLHNEWRVFTYCRCFKTLLGSWPRSESVCYHCRWSVFSVHIDFPQSYIWSIFARSLFGHLRHYQSTCLPRCCIHLSCFLRSASYRDEDSETVFNEQPRGMHILVHLYLSTRRCIQQGVHNIIICTIYNIEYIAFLWVGHHCWVWNTVWPLGIFYNLVHAVPRVWAAAYPFLSKSYSRLSDWIQKVLF